MQPIYTDPTAQTRDSIEGDLKHRKMLIQAGEELKRSPALQYYLQHQYHVQANNLLNLSVTARDGADQFAFMLAHNNVQARLDVLKTVWALGLDIEDSIMEYQEAVARNTLTTTTQE